MVKTVVRWVLYGFWLLLAVLVVDLILIQLNVFPPSVRSGNSQVGFLNPLPTGKEHVYRTAHSRFVHSDSGLITVNERGFRTVRSVREIKESPKPLTICTLGDSQTELPYRFEHTHSYIMQEALRSAGFDAEVLGAGRGGFSPLQAMIYFDTLVSDLNPSVIVLNLYTGNDLFDMIRMDDRPFYVSDNDGGYTIHPPLWYKYSDPADSIGFLSHSRLLYLARSVGLNELGFRVRYLISLSTAQGEGVGHALQYIIDLAATREPQLEYPPAFAAQELNQHLFFKYFPEARNESLRRLRYLLATMKAKYTDHFLVLSLLPSPVLCSDMQTNPLLLSTLERVDLNMDVVASVEEALYDSCVTIARDEGWFPISNKETLSSNCRGSWMMEDLHLSPQGSLVVGRHQARELRGVLVDAFENLVPQ